MNGPSAPDAKDVLVPEWLEKREPVESTKVDDEREGLRPRLKPINRQQLLMRSIDLERLIEPDHPARAIWEMLGQVDLSRFAEKIRAVEGRAGQASVDPRLLASLWIYGYSEGIGSAREISRMCEYEPGCQWLSGMSGVNYHTLSDFRVEHKEALDGLFRDVLGLLSAEGLVELKQVTQDGMKVKANAGVDTFRRQQRLEQHLELAEKQIEQMGDPGSELLSRRVAKARQRAVEEKKARLDLALEQLSKVRQSREKSEHAEARVSTSDPESRMMKSSDGGFAPAYNVQIATDVAHTIIVDVQAVQGGSDRDQLVPAVERVEQHVGHPQQLLADAGYTSHANIERMADKDIDLIAPVPDSAPNPQQYKKRGISDSFHNEAFQYDQASNRYVCPAGKILKPTGVKRHVGRVVTRYQAAPSDCRACPWHSQCCPKTKSRRISRSEDSQKVKAFIAKMETEEAKQVYRKRPQVAEFVNAWIKEKLGLRQFRLRGLIKVQAECLWAALTYNIQQWIRLRWRTPLAA